MNAVYMKGDQMEKIETRVPTGDAWVKTVTAVKPTAKTGYDWTGEFLISGKLIDLEPGTMVVTCDNGGSRKHPVKIAELYIFCSTMAAGSRSTG